MFLKINLILVFLKLSVGIDIGFVSNADTDAAVLTLVEPLPFEENKAATGCLINEYVCDDNSISAQKLLSSLKFTPPQLNFGRVRVGVPEELKVSISNVNHENFSIKLLSLSLSSMDENDQFFSFHPAFFQKNYLESGESTTFTVTYLPGRTNEQLQTHLFVHTHVGSVKMQIVARSVPNPYRLEAIRGTVVPVNTSYQTHIKIYNPFPTDLHIVELVTSGLAFNLEPIENAKQNWVIRPFETRSVMKTGFFATQTANYTGFLKFTLKSANDITDHIVIPIGFESSAEPGVYCNRDSLDFGQMVSNDSPKEEYLYLINTYPYEVIVQSVTSRNKVLNIDFKMPFTLPAKMNRFIKISTVFFNPNSLTSSKESCGDVIVKMTGPVKELKVPFRSKVLIGNLSIVRTKNLNFYSGSTVMQLGEITVRNNFQEALIVSNVYLEKDCAPDFVVEGFLKPVEIAAGSTADLGHLKFNPRPAYLRSLASYTSNIHVTSNISNFTLGFSCYSGLLSHLVECGNLDAAGKCLTEEDSEEDPQLDFGYLKSKTDKTLSLELINNNSVAIEVTEIKWTMEDTRIAAVGGRFSLDGHKLIDFTANDLSSSSNFAPVPSSQHEGAGGGSEAVQSSSSEGTIQTQLQRTPISIKQGRTKITISRHNSLKLSVTVSAPDVDEFRGGHLVVKTKYQTLRFRIHFRTLVGSLSVKKLIFKSFPYKSQKLTFALKNSFKHKLTLVKGEFQPSDPRFLFANTQSHSSANRNDSSVVSGAVVFNPLATCWPRCYLGINPQSSEAEQWVSSLQLPQDVADVDVGLLKPMLSRWESMRKKAQHKINVTAVLHYNPINEVVKFPVMAEMSWPCLALDNSVAFKLTHVGELSVSKMELKNPTDSPVVLQIIPQSLYHNMYKVLEVISSTSSSSAEEKQGSAQESLSEKFYLTNSEEMNKASNNPAIRFRADLEQRLDVKPSKQALSFILQPLQHLSVSVTYNASEPGEHQSMFFVRNNLTVVEVVTVSGMAVHLNLTLDGIYPLVTQDQYENVSLAKPIVFDLKPNYLAEHCNEKRSSFKVQKRRSLLLSNTGSLPLDVSSVLIDGVPCLGRGFFIENCDPLTGKVNFSDVWRQPQDRLASSSKLDAEKTGELVIVFHPDFTTTRIEAQLQIVLDMEPNMPKFFRLIATLPYSFISKCVATVPRPPWESYMYYAVVSAMIVLFFGALITSYYDAKKLILTTYSGGGDRRPIRPKKQIVISKDGKLMTTGGAGFHALKESQNGAADSGFSLLANDYITTRNNPDGTQGYVLDFKSQNANARHSHSSAVTKASKCEMASKRVSLPLGPRGYHTTATPALSVNRGPSTCTLQPNKNFVVVHQLPHGHRLSNTLKRIFWRPISQFILFTVTLILKMPVNFCHILKKVICVFLYVLICLGSTCKQLSLKTHRVGTAFYCSYVAYSKSKTVLDTPTKRSQATDTHSLITGRRKNKRAAQNSSYLNNGNSRNNKSSSINHNNSKFSKSRNVTNNDESAEEHADPGDEKDSPHLYETQEEQTSRTSTPELVQSKLPGMGQNGRSDSMKAEKNKQRVKTSSRKQKVLGSSEIVFVDTRESGAHIGRFSTQERNCSPAGSLEGDSCSVGSEGGFVFDDDDEMSMANYDRNSVSNGDGKNHNSCMYNEPNTFQSQSRGGSRISRFSNGTQYDESINEGVRNRKQNLFWQEHEQKRDCSSRNNGSGKGKKSNTIVTGGTGANADRGYYERRNSEGSCEQNGTSGAGEGDIDAPPGFEGFLSNVISRPRKKLNANESCFLGSEHGSYHQAVVSNAHTALQKVPSMKNTSSNNRKESSNSAPSQFVVSIGAATNARKHLGAPRIGNTCNLSRTNSGSSLSDFTAPLATPIGLANFRKAKEEFLRSDTTTVKMGPTLKSAHLRMTQNEEARSSALPFKNNWRIPVDVSTTRQERHRHDFTQSAPFSFNRDRYLPGVNIGDSLFGYVGGANSPLPCSTEHSNYGSNEQLEGAAEMPHKYSNIQIDSSWPPESQLSTPVATSFASSAEKSPAAEKFATKKESKFCKIFQENSAAAESAKKHNEACYAADSSSQRAEKLLGESVYDTSPSGMLWNTDAIALGKSDSPGFSLWNSSLMPYLEDSQSSKTDDLGFKKQQKHLSRIWEQDMPSPLCSPVNNDGDLGGPLRSMGGPCMYTDTLPTLFENPFSSNSISDLWKPLSLGRAPPETAWGARRRRSAAFPVAPFDEDKEEVAKEKTVKEVEEKETEEKPSDEKLKGGKARNKEKTSCEKV